MGGAPAFVERWSQTFGEPLIAYQLRADHPQRWVRFHSLPGAKRYPDDEAEWAVVLGRWDRVIRDVLRGRVGWLVATVTEPEDARWPFELGTPIPQGPLTTAVGCDPWEMRVWPYRHGTGAIRAWLRSAARGDVVNTLFVDRECRRLAAPYDGGIDVILATREERDALRDRHSEWLSARPDGL